MAILRGNTQLRASETLNPPLDNMAATPAHPYFHPTLDSPCQCAVPSAPLAPAPPLLVAPGLCRASSDGSRGADVRVGDTACDATHSNVCCASSLDSGFRAPSVGAHSRAGDVLLPCRLRADAAPRRPLRPLPVGDPSKLPSPVLLPLLAVLPIVLPLVQVPAAGPPLAPGIARASVPCGPAARAPCASPAAL